MMRNLLAYVVALLLLHGSGTARAQEAVLRSSLDISIQGRAALSVTLNLPVSGDRQCTRNTAAQTSPELSTFRCEFDIQLSNLSENTLSSLIRVDLSFANSANFEGSLYLRGYALATNPHNSMNLDLQHGVFSGQFSFTSQNYRELIARNQRPPGNFNERIREYLIARNSYLRYPSKDQEEAAKLLRNWVTRAYLLSAAAASNFPSLFALDQELITELQRIRDIQDPNVRHAFDRSGPRFVSQPLPNAYVSDVDKFLHADWSIYGQMRSLRDRGDLYRPMLCGLASDFAARWRNANLLTRGIVTHQWRVSGEGLQRDLRDLALTNCPQSMAISHADPIHSVREILAVVLSTVDLPPD